MSLRRSFGVLGPLRAINIALLKELKTRSVKTRSDDNPPKLMYKGKAERLLNGMHGNSQRCFNRPPTHGT